MAREAFLPLFVGDFLSSTVTWDGEEKALYLLLLAYQWAAGPLPADPARLAKTAGYDLKRFAKLWEVVGTKFELTDGGLSNPRLEVHRAKSHEVSRRRAEAGAKGGQATRQTASKTEAIATARLEHPSHPIPSHRSLPSGERGGERADAPAALPPERPKPFDVSTVPGISLEAWEAWEGYRAARKPAIKPESRQAAAKALAAYGPDQMAVVQQSIANGYQGLVPLKSKETSRGTSPQSPRKSAVDRVREATGCDLREIVGAPPPRVVGTG